MRRLGTGTVEVGSRERELVNEVLESGWFSPGEKVREFEKKFAAAHDQKFGVMTNSGTDALRIALGALKEKYRWNDFDEVLVPAMTFVATANIVYQNRLTPVFVDVDPVTLNMDPLKLERAVTRFSKAVIPVHLFGRMADMPEIMEVAQNHRLLVLEDSCETMGVRFRSGESAGSFGQIACFSTYACHLIVTGVGGMAITSDPELAHYMRSLMNHGRKGDTREERFVFERMGYSCRPTEFEAALGLAQLERLPEILKARQLNAQALDSMLRGTDEWLQRQDPDPVDREHAWMMYPLILRDEAMDRKDFCDELEKKGIETRPLFPLLGSPLYRRLRPDLRECYPIADHASKRGFYIGCHQGLTGDDLGYMAESILSVYDKQKSHVYA